MKKSEDSVVKKIEAKEGFVTVTSTVLGSSKTQSKKIKIRPFIGPTATVSCKFGATIPAGDWRSIRVDVMLSVPCYVEEIVDVFEQLKSLTDRLVDTEVKRLTEDLEG